VLGSLRFRLPALFLLGVVLAGFVASLIAIRFFQSYERTRAIGELRAESVGIVRLEASQAGARDVPISNLEAAIGGDRIFYVPIVRGAQLFTGPLPQLPSTTVSAVELNRSVPQVFDLHVAGRHYLAVAQPLRLGDQLFGALVVAKPASQLRSRWVTLVERLAIAFGGGVIVASLLGVYLSRRLTRPLLALSIAEFPEELPQETVAAILGAADEQVRAAGAILAGGHTIRDKEPKYGLAVVGTVHPDGIWPKAGARAGDALFLTKPLGTGLVLHGATRGLTGEEHVRPAVDWMTTLNRDWADVLRGFRPHAVTDVTGFGLLGHAHEMADRSGVRIVLEAALWPALDGALEVARAGEKTGGDPRNRDFAAAHVTADGIPEELLILGYDPQTAGGMLVSLPAEQGASLVAELGARNLFVRRIGRVEAGAGVAVT
jgi:selenide,water dikinase